MKAKIFVTLKTGSIEEMQKRLDNLFLRILRDGEIEDYHFEIETENGIITEECILSEGKVIA
ncbi:MAG: hypothetical protein EHM54_10760 [Nitrospiraceae bacterium]|jgi:hypothetical protein|nr:MAG: hypothetical protein EHM54_10760 [Nitrospiraceae bacterium]